MRKIKKYFKYFYNQFFQTPSIQTSIILSFMFLISVIALAFSTLAYNFTLKDLKDMSINYTNRFLTETTFSVDSYISSMKNMTQVIIQNNDVHKLMDFYRNNPGKNIPAEQQHKLDVLNANVVNHLNTVAKTRDDITNIAVISKKGNVILSDKSKRVNPYAEYNVTDWFLRPQTNKDDIVVSPSHVQNLVADEYKWVISISKAIVDPSSGEIYGVMVIDLNYNSIANICKNVQIGASGYIYLIDNDRNIIYHPQQQLLYSGIKTEMINEILKQPEGTIFYSADKKKIYLKNYSKLTGWTAVGVVKTNELIKNKRTIIDFYIFLTAVILAVATTLAVIISRTITRPIKKLENTMHRVEEGDFNVKSEIELNNEIGHLSTAFNMMISKIKLLMAQVVADEEEKRRNEIKALQAQINPHFLYNTLDTIIWLSASGRSEEVAEVTAALAKLFRTSISEGSDLVPLRTEIGNINSYLTIQKVRYMDKLTYKINVPMDLLGMKLPKLILQPIVENSIYHGIKMSPTGGEIIISAQPRGDLLILTVTDNGVGMSKEKMDSMFEPGEHNHTGTRIGVANVNNRIKLYFGERYGVFYYSKEGVGTRAEICLPMIKEGGENNA